MPDVTYNMPAAITPEMIRVLKAHPDTQIEDRDEWHTRLGWLISAWDVLIEHRQPPPPAEGFEGPDGARWRKLVVLAGHWQDSSDTEIKLSQDDATRQCLVHVGPQAYVGRSFEAIVDAMVIAS